jgi:hypothetical protein
MASCSNVGMGELLNDCLDAREGRDTGATISAIVGNVEKASAFRCAGGSLRPTACRDSGGVAKHLILRE